MQIHLPVDSVTVMSCLRGICLFVIWWQEKLNYPSWRVRGTGVACKQTTSEITRLVANVTACVARISEPISASEWRSFIAGNVNFH